MSKINELRTQRAKLWEQAKNFLDSHRKNGILSAEDTATYEKMEKDIVDLGHEIERQQRADAFEREMNAPVSTPIIGKPETAKADTKVGRAADDYKDSFWKQMRNKAGIEARNVLSVGSDSEGGFLVPDTYETTLVQSLNDEMVIRRLAHVFTTSSGSHKIPVVATQGTASWVEESGEIPEGNDTFGQKFLDAHKLTALIKVSEELLNDSAFDLEGYFRSEFARRISNAEEVAFISGNGQGKPTGLFSDTEGADVGITTASATAITADEIMNLYYSLRAPYRKNAVWLMNDATVNAIRLLKDKNGQYLWQPALKDGTYDTLLGRPVHTSTAVPTIAGGNKVMAFGDLSYYWIGDREGITFRRLNELYAAKGQVGFLATKRVDAKLMLPEAVKTLKMKGSTAEPA